MESQDGLITDDEKVYANGVVSGVVTKREGQTPPKKGEQV